MLSISAVIARLLIVLLLLTSSLTVSAGNQVERPSTPPVIAPPSDSPLVVKSTPLPLSSRFKGSLTYSCQLLSKLTNSSDSLRKNDLGFDGCPKHLLMGTEMVNITFVYHPPTLNTWISRAVLSVRRATMSRIPAPNSTVTPDFCNACKTACIGCVTDTSKMIMLLTVEIPLTMSGIFHYIYDPQVSHISASEVNENGAQGLDTQALIQVQEDTYIGNITLPNTSNFTLPDSEIITGVFSFLAPRMGVVNATLYTLLAAHPANGSQSNLSDPSSSTASATPARTMVIGPGSSQTSSASTIGFVHTKHYYPIMASSIVVLLCMI
ncbi:hypothetical protein O5D80_002907 [Batrachochytrium dendrobatidis]|nr:hypothetical protein O5D80_002907 [Batrachochytrium dendrobatidis]